MKRCYLCGFSIKPFITVKKRSIVRCSTCRLTYTKNLLQSTATGENSRKFVDEYVSEAVSYREYFTNIIDIIRKYKQPGTLLDVGCGVGIFLQRVKETGWKAVGVDLSSGAVQYARAHGLDVRLGEIEKMKFRPRSFDVITLFQTIEHIDDPLNILKILRVFLRNGGLLLMTTPSEESFMAKLMGKYWFGYRNVEHIYFYNKHSMTVLLQKAGFRNITMHSENSRALSVPWVLTRIFEYYYNQKSLLSSLIVKTRPYWKYLNWIRFREPDVNLVLTAVK